MIDESPIPCQTDSPMSKKQRQCSSDIVFSDGLADCSGIVNEFPSDNDGNGLNRLSLSQTIDFNQKPPKFCSTQYIELPEHGFPGVDDSYDGNFLPPVPANQMKRQSMKRKSLTARVSTMPTLPFKTVQD